MRRAAVFKNGILAGFLEEDISGYIFRYDEAYYLNPSTDAISLTLPKSCMEYKSDFLFPFFSNMVAEGTNLEIQSRYLKIDARDTLGFLLATASYDSIGAITLKIIEENES